MFHNTFLVQESLHSSLGKKNIDARNKKANISVGDLFSGAGAFSYAFREAGFKICFGNEINSSAAKTFKKNHPEAEMIEGDITSVDIKKQIIDYKGMVDVIIGGIPCVAFSMAGNRFLDDERGQLYKHFFKIIEEIDPVAFVIENVKGLLSMKTISDPTDEERELMRKYRNFVMLYKSKQQRELNSDEKREFDSLKPEIPLIKKSLSARTKPLLNEWLKIGRELGYNVVWKLLRSDSFGTPQIRERIFIVGIKQSLNLFYNFPVRNNHHDKKCVKDAIHDLEDKPELFIPNHVFTNHSEAMVLKMGEVKQGDTLYDYSDAWFRLEPYKKAKTVKSCHGGHFIHYSKNRVLTPRELARLQDFPDSFEFMGTKSDIIEQIGNAIPINLGFAIAKSLMNQLKSILN